MKHVILHGMQPGEIKEFDHEILGGGIKRIVEEPFKKKFEKKITKTNEKQGDDIL